MFKKRIWEKAIMYTGAAVKIKRPIFNLRFLSHAWIFMQLQPAEEQ